MVRYVNDMMLDSAEAPVTSAILSMIAILDENGAWDWNLRLLSLAWFLVFAAIRLLLGKTGGIDWYALIHALITGIGGIICAYLSFAMAEQLTGTKGARAQSEDIACVTLLPVCY